MEQSQCRDGVGGRRYGIEVRVSGRPQTGLGQVMSGSRFSDSQPESHIHRASPFGVSVSPQSTIKILNVTYIL